MRHLLLLVCAFALMLFTACEEDSPEKLNAEDLMGSWDLLSLSASYGVKTSSQQQAVLIFAPGIGGITVNGDFEENLDYLYMYDFGFYQIAMVSNHIIFEEELPSYMLSVAFQEGETSLTLAITQADSSSYSFSSENVVASFDPGTLSLELAPLTMTSDDGSKQISLSGILAVRQVLLPADEYTEFDYLEDVDPGSLLSYSFTFLEDHTLTILVTEMDGVDTTLATWELQDDELLITNLDEEEGTLTGVMDVSFEDDELWLMSTLDCSEEASPSECLSEGESLLLLESGSVTEFKEMQTLKFTRGGLARRSWIRHNKSYTAQENMVRRQIHESLTQRMLPLR